MQRNQPGKIATGGITRRAFGTLLGSATAAILAPPDVAEAGRGWCRTDPLMLINGDLVDIFCTAPLSLLLSATGPTEIVVTVPKGIKAHLLLAGPGFGRGEKVRIEKSNELKAGKRRVDVQVDVFIPANDDLEVGVEFAPRLLGILDPDIAEGRTNSWVTLKTKL